MEEKESNEYDLFAGLSYLNGKEREFLAFLLGKRLYEFTPIDISKMMNVSNKTVINRCAKLADNGFAVPVIVKERIRSYRLSNFSRTNAKILIKECLK